LTELFLADLLFAIRVPALNLQRPRVGKCQQTLSLQ
jgi:hypothetical protein